MAVLEVIVCAKKVTATAAGVVPRTKAVSVFPFDTPLRRGIATKPVVVVPVKPHKDEHAAAAERANVLADVGHAQRYVVARYVFVNEEVACDEHVEVEPRSGGVAVGTKNATATFVPTVSPAPVAVKTLAGRIPGGAVEPATVTEVSASDPAFTPKTKDVSPLAELRIGMYFRGDVAVVAAAAKRHMFWHDADAESAKLVADTGHMYMYVLPRNVFVAGPPLVAAGVQIVAMPRFGGVAVGTTKATGTIEPAVNGPPGKLNTVAGVTVGAVPLTHVKAVSVVGGDTGLVPKTKDVSEAGVLRIGMTLTLTVVAPKTHMLLQSEAADMANLTVVTGHA